MTAVKTDIGAQTRAENVTHSPTADIPFSNVWDAIKYVRDTLTAAIAQVASDASAALTAHLSDTADAHDASAISVVDAGTYFTGTDVEAALQEAGAAISALNDILSPLGAATDNVVPRWDATGTAFQTSGVTISDTDIMAGLAASVIGHTAQISSNAIGTLPTLQGHISGFGIGFGLFRWDASLTGATAEFCYSRNSTVGVHAIVQDGDSVANLVFKGSDGQFFRLAASIKAAVDGTPSLGIVPGRLVLATTNSSGTSVDRVVLDSAGALKPATNGGAALGTTSLGYSALHLAAGAHINWDNSAAVITQDGSNLVFGGHWVPLVDMTFDVGALDKRIRVGYFGDLLVSTSATLPNTGLHLLDTDASHDLIVKPGSNLSADRTLTVTTGDADRTLDISAGSVTISAFGASLLDDTTAADARSTLGAVGAALTPIVILATGQSNFAQTPSLSWTPPANAVIWNWDGVDGHVGTAFQALDGTKINPAWKFAAEVARNRPDAMVYLINVSFGGQAISHWKTGTGAPDVFDNIQDNVGPALTAIGVEKIDLLLWWQGESDASSPGTYKADFETVMGRFEAEDWFELGTRVVIFGIVSSAISSNAAHQPMNVLLQQVAAAKPDRRVFTYPAAFPIGYWDSGSSYLHMTADGYNLAGLQAYQNFEQSAHRGVLHGVVVDPETGNVVIGSGVGSDAKLTLTFNQAPAPATAVGAGSSLLHCVGGDGAANLAYLDSFGGITAYAMRRANGTLASRTALVADDLIGQVTTLGWNGSSYAGGCGRIRIVAVDNFDGSKSGAYLSIDTVTATTNASTERARFGADGSVAVPTIGTTASAANAFLDSGSTPANKLLRSTSSLAFKKDVEEIDLSYAHRMLNEAKPIWYRSKAAADNPAWSWWGYGAEDIADIDPRCVQWGYGQDDLEAVTVGDGQDTWVEYRPKAGAAMKPQGVMYDRVALMQIAALKSRVQGLEEKLSLALQSSDGN